VTRILTPLKITLLLLLLLLLLAAAAVVVEVITAVHSYHYECSKATRWSSRMLILLSVL
jgi:hypothetical protein